MPAILHHWALRVWSSSPLVSCFFNFGFGSPVHFGFCVLEILEAFSPKLQLSVYVGVSPDYIKQMLFRWLDLAFIIKTFRAESASMKTSVFAIVFWHHFSFIGQWFNLVRDLSNSWRCCWTFVSSFQTLLTVDCGVPQQKTKKIDFHHLWESNSQ